ncbi:hypothetical protein NHX12_010992 [Muraenolepis orangiensis]|uniref:Uncharacterized protein n=1 Tax=Muraenolepis orangiensis TaxID=630683 RepID=A0A9Q0I685_9TELE|nr:hypothetical protein NHX12_010992 [Muraenolepis orangiensis]
MMLCGMTHDRPEPRFNKTNHRLSVYQSGWRPVTISPKETRRGASCYHISQGDQAGGVLLPYLPRRPGGGRPVTLSPKETRRGASCYPIPQGDQAGGVLLPYPPRRPGGGRPVTLSPKETRRGASCYPIPQGDQAGGFARGEITTVTE